MLNIQRKIINYKCILTGLDVSHYVLIADYKRSSKLLLSHPNLFLYEKTRPSLSTSNRYSNVISKFYRFLSTLDKFKEIHLKEYHVVADNNDIKSWQVQRQIKRVNKGKTYPTSATIYDDAKLILVYFSWIKDNDFVTCVKVNTKTWIANFKSADMLNHVQKRAKKKVDSANITVLDKERRQRKIQNLITNDEIEGLLASYSDPAYSSLFKLSLATAMRPMDLCKFPYLGFGENRHIKPYSNLGKKYGLVDFLVESSKGNKSRKIKINLQDLSDLENEYIIPFYQQRAEKYKERFGKKCPPSILFLNKFGVPITTEKISSRTHDAVKKAHKINPSIRNSLDFYQARHWWPTMFLIQFFGDELLTDSAEVLYAAAVTVLENQMGHSDIETTYRYYIDKARILMITKKGLVNDLFNENSKVRTVGSFVRGFNNTDVGK